MKKENIKKYVGAGMVSIAILAGAGLGIVEATTDHTHEWCPLNSILGVEHQMRKIENSFEIAYYKDESGHTHSCNFDVIFAKDGIVEYVRDAGFTMDEDGKKIYHTSEGYLSGTKAVKRIQYAEGDAIIINKSAPERIFAIIPVIGEESVSLVSREIPLSFAEELFESGYVKYLGNNIEPYSEQIVIKKTK